MSIFDMNTEQLAAWAKNTAPGQDGCGIHPRDAEKLARKIINKNITGAQMSNLGEDGIRNLFPPGWKAEVVNEFSQAVQRKREEEIIQQTQHQNGGANPDIPPNFVVNVGGIGTQNKTIRVEKAMTFQAFKERLYEAEIGHLSNQPAQRQRELNDFNLVGTKVPPPNDYHKTLEELDWRPGHAIHATYTTGGGIVFYFTILTQIILE
mmetsp:Transcript_10479/g.15741  ORF Transcript_10479/g.15741 Transcript_10479/m.15741 type:complete len:207 (+) Transcript_10479:60-680(+)